MRSDGISRDLHHNGGILGATETKMLTGASVTGMKKTKGNLKRTAQPMVAMPGGGGLGEGEEEGRRRRRKVYSRGGEREVEAALPPPQHSP